jgi:hypothetical protein
MPSFLSLSPFTKNIALLPPPSTSGEPLICHAAGQARASRGSSQAHVSSAPLIIAQDPLRRPQSRIMPPPPPHAGEPPPPCASPPVAFLNCCLKSVSFSSSYKTQLKSATPPSTANTARPESSFRLTTEPQLPGRPV